MRRREFLKSSGLAAIAFPWPALAQKDLPLVAVLVPGSAKLANDRIVAIRKGMQEAGLAEDVNYAFALRFADGVFDRLPGFALELAALKPRVIVASAAAATAVHKVVPDLPRSSPRMPPTRSRPVLQKAMCVRAGTRPET
jgi:putative ABC transport system substrate-binding protein